MCLTENQTRAAGSVGIFTCCGFGGCTVWQVISISFRHPPPRRLLSPVLCALLRNLFVAALPRTTIMVELQYTAVEEVEKVCLSRLVVRSASHVIDHRLADPRLASN